jgi:hypothetical protein
MTISILLLGCTVIVIMGIGYAVISSAVAIGRKVMS